jgi:F-type H+-transporting ATPase subunit delta
MSVAVVARRYAQAVLELGIEQGSLDTIVAQVESLAEAWNASAELQSALDNPLVSQADKRAVMGELADASGVGQTAKNTLLLLVDRRRTRALPYLAMALRELADARKGLVRAEVTTATPLADSYYERLRTELERMTGMHVVVDRRTDPSLIAGVVTRIGDRVFDGSVRTGLLSLRDALLPSA